MLARPAFKLSSLIIPPLMLGIGIGIGAVGSANASTVTSAVSNAIRTAANSVQCATTQTACLSVTNTVKSGVAIIGASQNGLGVEGTSMSSVGVTGASQYSIGLNGKSVNGFAVHGVSALSNGVVGTSNGANGVGVIGTNTSSGSGVQAIAGNGTALVASNSGLPDPLGITPTPPTVLINGKNNYKGDGLDIYTEGGTDPIMGGPNGGPAIFTTAGDVYTNIGGSDYAITAVSGTTGYHFAGSGIQTISNNIGLSAETDGSGQTYIATPTAIEATAPNGGDLYIGYGKGTFEVTNDGNVNASGTLTSGVTCAPATCGNGVTLATYATRNASPAMEDFGRAQMVNGSATVRFDATFAGTIDAKKDYHVFLTPEGDNRGLYVARRTAAGFVVGESLGGHSTLAFSYRVVASPYGSTASRLPVIRTQRFAAAAFAEGQRSIKAMKQKGAEIRSRVNKLSLSQPLK